MNKLSWSKRYAAEGTGLTPMAKNMLSAMATKLNSHAYSYTGKSGQSPTDRMYKGAGGADLDNQDLLKQQRSQYHTGADQPIANAVNQINLFTGKESYTSDIRTNAQKHPEFHHLVNNAPSVNNPALHRGFVLTDVRHGTPGQPVNVKDIYKVGDVVNHGMTSTSSDPNLAKAWVMDDKNRIDAAQKNGDTTVLDKQYGGARNFAYVNHHFPAGSQALQVAPLSAVPEHNEFALAANKFKVSKVTGPDSDGVNHVYWDKAE